jgi:hypothetical protein
MRPSSPSDPTRWTSTDHAADPRADPREAPSTHRGGASPLAASSSRRSSSDPGRSDLLAQCRQAGDGPGSTLEPPPENYAFDDHLVYESARGAGGRLITSLRRLLNPVLKLFINPNPIIQVLHRQSAINAYNREQFDRIADLNYEVMHNLVVELTRLGIEVKNLKMRLESLSGRLDFSDRRARALGRRASGRAPDRHRAGGGTSPASTGGQGGQAASKQAVAHGAPIRSEAQRARRRRGRRGRGGAPGQPVPGSGAGATRWARPVTRRMALESARRERRRRNRPAVRRRRAGPRRRPRQARLT